MYTNSSLTSNNTSNQSAKKEKVVLAYSGGLDTSVCLKWLQVEKNLDVIAVCGNVGQDEKNLEYIKQKALSMGAIASKAIDMREEYSNEYLTKALAANSLYENVYPLLSALSRPLLSKYMVEIAHEYGASYIAHGCTGKGNDQVRFETSIKALDPSLQIIAPVREWDLHTRDDEIEWAHIHNVPVPATKQKPYSIDDNLWGRAIECGTLEDPWSEPPADIWTMTKDPKDAPDEETHLVISFNKGVPCAINGHKMSFCKIISSLNIIAGNCGYGRIDTIENRLVGVKSRECYEVPGAKLLIEAHKALETLCLDRDTQHFKLNAEHTWATSVYNGLWFSPLKNALDAFFADTQQFVTGDVHVKLYKGSLTILGRKSAYSLYDFGLASYGEADTFNRYDAEGFIHLHSLPVSVWAKEQGLVQEENSALPASNYLETNSIHKQEDSVA